MATTFEPRLRLKTMTPSLTVDDLQRSIKFFEGLGFEIDERWEEEGRLLGVMLKAGDTRLGINQDDWKKGRGRQKGVGMRLFLNTTQNIDDLAAQVKAAGVALDREPTDAPWGRSFDVIEPSGFKLTIMSERS